MTLQIPVRAGERPVTTEWIPHQQISDNPSSALHAATRERFLALAGCDLGPSLISVPGATALFVPECEHCRQAAMMRGREFAHIHPGSDGSFHMVLDASSAAHVMAQGWGELHPLCLTGELTEQVLMVYAPRDEAEIDVIMEIAAASRAYAVS